MSPVRDAAGRARGVLRRSSAAAMAAAAYVLLVLAWSLGNPPFASPDEAAHYIRAVGLGTGQLAGEADGFPYTPGTNRVQLDFMNRYTRAYHLPAGLSPQPWQCGFWVDERTTGACLMEAEPIAEPVRELSYVGAYLPVPYALPGLGARAGSDAATGNLLGRLAGGVLHALLLVAAVLLVWDRRRAPVALLGVFVAVTPMVVFVASTLNPSALEVTAGVAFACALLRLLGRGDARTGVWVAVGVTGALLTLSRATGPAWLALQVVLAVLLVGPRQAWSVASSHTKHAAAVAVALLASVGLNRLWEALYSSSPTVSLEPFPDSVVHGFRQLPLFFQGQVAGLGYLEFHLPSLVLSAWWALLFVLLGAAALVGRRRERWALSLGLGGAILLPVAFYALLYQHSGFGLQGRYLLPLAVMIPLAAGEIVRRNPEGVAHTTLAGAARWVALVAASVHVFAWYWNARRYAVGADGPLLFLGRSEWTPAIGWPAAFALLAAGAVGLAAAGWMASASFVLEPGTGRGAAPADGSRRRRSRGSARGVRAT